MVAAAFVGWQNGAGQKKNFDEYLRGFGLTEPERQIDSEQKKEIAARARKLAERIARMDKGR
jgi:hypothetical protein